MGYIPVKIDGGNLARNKFTDGDKVYLATSLIEQSKNLPVFDAPLSTIYLGSEVFTAITNVYDLANHMKRVQETSLEHPIIMDERGFIMDGWHRVAKALLEGRSTIKAVRFEQTPAPDYYKQD